MIQHNRRSALIGLTAAPFIVAQTDSGGHVPPQYGVDPRDRGAKCDGRTDDTAALQAAVQECLNSDPPIPLVLSGPCLITRSIMIDREVDQSSHYFIILGLGPAAGFVTRTAITIFSTSLLVTNDPRSAGISFNNITFEGRSTKATVASGKFLRMKFLGCSFIGIPCLNTQLYAQEWSFVSCYATRWPGTFFSSAGGYHITSTNSKYHFGGIGFHMVDPTRQRAGCIGCSFLQDSFESNDGPFITADQARALTVQSLYSEGNNHHVLDFSLRGPNRGILVSSCFFRAREMNTKNVEFAEIRWGTTVTGTSLSNVSEARLHESANMMPGALTVIGDTILTA